METYIKKEIGKPDKIYWLLKSWWAKVIFIGGVIFWTSLAFTALGKLF